MYLFIHFIYSLFPFYFIYFLFFYFPFFPIETRLIRLCHYNIQILYTVYVTIFGLKQSTPGFHTNTVTLSKPAILNTKQVWQL